MRKALLTSAALALFAPVAHAELFVLGSTFTVDGANTPGDVNTTVALNPGTGAPLSTSAGPLDLHIQETPVAGGGEWLSFGYFTPDFASGLVGDVNANWHVNEVGLQANQSVKLVSGFVSFNGAGGGNVAPQSCGLFGGSFSIAPSPVSGSGPGCLSTSPGGTFSAGPLPALGTSINPFSLITTFSSTTPTVYTGYFEALEFMPTSTVITPTPEPSTFAIMGVGLLGMLGVVARRRRTP